MKKSSTKARTHGAEQKSMSVYWTARASGPGGCSSSGGAMSSGIRYGFVFCGWSNGYHGFAFC